MLIHEVSPALLTMTALLVDPGAAEAAKSQNPGGDGERARRDSNPKPSDP